MSNLNHPAIALLNPERGDAVPVGFTRHRLTLTAGVPLPLPIAVPGIDGALLLALPSGRIRSWLALPENETIASGAAQRRPVDPATDQTSIYAAARCRTSPQLLLVSNRMLADTWPLVLGARHILERGPPGARVAVAELLLLDFLLTASAVTSGAPSGCWIDLAMRALGGSSAFRAPMVAHMPQQQVLERHPENLAFDMQFDSTVDATPFADGTPVGGINWWLSHDRG